jgi:1-phosphofructokinase family hexose kinase
MSGGITVVTPNPAIDVTYRCAAPRWGEVNRVERVTRRAGGKGLNVANVLAQLGLPVRVTGFVGGLSGRELRNLCTADGITQDWVDIAGATRSTTAIHGDDETTLFNEPGPQVEPEDWQRLTAAVVNRLGNQDVLVVSGSCPPGTTDADLAGMLLAARSAGALTLVDTSGSLLLAASPYADLLKPNREELQDATGMTDTGQAARSLLAGGAGAVAVSAGVDGMDLFLQGSDSWWHASPATLVKGNPTGAGDAAVAAFAAGMLRVANGADRHQSLIETLGRAVALSGAAVLAPVAGVVDTDAYETFHNDISVEVRNHAPRQPA